MAGIRDILVITTPQDGGQFQHLLGDGSRFVRRLDFAQQPTPDGIVQAFLMGAEHIGTDTVALVLGDNIFYGPGMGTQLQRHTGVTGGLVFGYRVKDPSAYGVATMDAQGRDAALPHGRGAAGSRRAAPGVRYSHCLLGLLEDEG